MNEYATIFPLFSSPLFVRENIIYDNKKIFSFLESCEWETVEAKNGKSTLNHSILLEEELKDVKNIIEENLKIYLFDFLKISSHHTLKHTSSWAMCHERGHYAQQHMHKNSMYSGVLYVKVPENSGNLLLFDSSDHQPTYCSQTISPDIAEYNLYNSRHFRLPVDETTLVIFPSHMYHRTLVSETDAKRICIAFNYFLGGKYNCPTAEIDL